MPLQDLGSAAIRTLHEMDPSMVTEKLAGFAESVGATDIVLYLVDFGHTVLVPIPDRRSHLDLPVNEPVDTGVAGAAFREQRVRAEPTQAGTRIWAPILEGSDCTGVVALTIVDEIDKDIVSYCEDLGLLAGLAIATTARSTDLYHLVRRRKAMSLPASMQWDLLPPLRLSAPGVTSVGILEPAYDVGGDCFDHSMNGLGLDVAIMDAMGHGLSSSVVAALAMGTYRHDRREGQPLETIHYHLNEVIQHEFNDSIFVTGQLARLAVPTGRLTWINAGHPLPLLIRDGHVHHVISCAPSLPWGIGGALVEQATEQLQPGDAVLFYSDGVTEGRSANGEPFSQERLINLVERATQSNRPTTSTLRKLLDDVLAHQNHRLQDDATLIWLAWNGPHSP